MKFSSVLSLALLITCSLAHISAEAAEKRGNNLPAVEKIGDILVYSNATFYSAFPSVVRRPNGELIVAFRRAPNWRPLGAKGYTHTDPNSYLVLVRSKDDAKTWTKEPELIFSHPFGGSQDPCMLQLRDNSILCSSYGWSYVQTNVFAKLKQPILHHGQYVFLGGYMVRSTDGGKSWGNLIVPPPRDGETHHNLFGDLCPAYNRGAMCEGKDGRIFWVVASNESLKPRNTSTHLMISEDKGNTWKYSCVVASDPKVTFNETSISSAVAKFVHSGSNTRARIP